MLKAKNEIDIKTKLRKWRLSKMKTEKKELIKKFKVVIDDLMDNYEQYTDEEKAQIKEIFQKVADLNTLLDKYDDDVKFDWQEYIAAYGQYFNMMYH
jgi:predicted methyltransferase